MTASPPPDDVLRAFGLPGEPAHLPGGISQNVWRVGDAVLKPVQERNPGEGDWVADVLDAIDEDGFRVAKPLRSVDGGWLVGEWTAWRWLDGEHRAHNWTGVIEAARAFHRAMPRAIQRAGRDAEPSWLATRQHRWARSERTVWHGAPLPPAVNQGAQERSLFERAIALGPPLTAGEEAASQLVHGDVAGNVLVDSAGVFALIDMSPGWRTSASVDAQIAIEAVAWFGGSESLLDDVPVADAARACAFRLLCGLQASANWAVDYPTELERWTKVLGLIGA